MPRPLFIALCMAASLLTVDAIVWMFIAEESIDYLVPIIDLSVVGLYAVLHRRNPTVILWTRTIALVWGVLGIVGLFLYDFSTPVAAYATVMGFIEIPTFLGLYLVLRMPSSKRYLDGTGVADAASSTTG